MSMGKSKNLNLESLRVAIVHDYLKEIGGAERVLMTLKEIFPQATVFTAFKFPEYWGGWRDLLSGWDIHESWGRWLPFLPKLISYYTPISPLFFGAMDLSPYDLVIVSATGGYFPNGVRIGVKTKLITYCHTPPRFLYGYPTATAARYKWYWRPISEFVNVILRQVDFRFAQRPHLLIANSRNIASRIAKFYRREARVVYPPVENLKFEILNSKYEARNSKQKGGYYLIVSRIVGGKNIEIAMEAAKIAGFKLKVAGRPIGRSGEEIVAAMKEEGFDYLGEVSDEEKMKLMAGSRAFLALESDADFGVTAVEPQMLGVPVVAYKGGGYMESVVDGKTGLLFSDLSAQGLIGAIERFERMRFDPKDIIANAKRFSKDRFKEDMTQIIKEIYA